MDLPKPVIASWKLTPRGASFQRFQLAGFHRLAAVATVPRGSRVCASVTKLSAFVADLKAGIQL